MHTVWAAVGLVVRVEQLREMLEAGRIGQVRKVLKQSAGLLEALLTGRTRLHHLTLHLPAVANLSASQIELAGHGIKEACIALRVPTPWCACVLSDGKLVCASPGWTRVQRTRCGAGMGADADGCAQGEAALDQSDVLKFLLHLLAACCTLCLPPGSLCLPGTHLVPALITPTSHRLFWPLSLTVSRFPPAL